MLILDDNIYTSDQFIEKMENLDYEYSRRGKIKYINIACAFDIETSSFMIDDRKQVITYVWQLDIGGYIVVGRYWSQFYYLILRISETFKTNPDDVHLVIYIHNLSYEFQFMRKIFKWYKIFSLDTREPLYAITDTGIEFRCSYLLSGVPLRLLHEEILTYDFKKKVGDLDYDLIRTPLTPLTEKELGYIKSDVKVVTAYIDEKIQNEGGLSKIPLTKTGYVRNYCRNKCLYINDKRSLNTNYINLIKNLTLEPEEYKYAKQAFQGGFTHANFMYVQNEYSRLDKIIQNVKSKDFTSSYPAVMLSEYFPMSKGKKVRPKNKEEFYNLIKTKCCIFYIEMYDLIENENVYDNPISASRILATKEDLKTYDVIENNGRVVSAKRVNMIITEVDFEVYKTFYHFKFSIGDMWVYDRGYLPKELVNCVLDFYKSKTTLKDVEGKERDYMLSKGLLNAIYGMMVTDICRDEIIYDDEWSKNKPDIDEQIPKYNKSKKRFLFYPWGVYITAYARRNLFSGIYNLGSDYIYSDTDSVKYKNPDKHENYFNNYNILIQNKIKNCLSYHGINVNEFKPKTKYGIEKPLGVWDDDGDYTRFKTLGAKRYLVEFKNKKGELDYKLTVAGLNKKEGMKFLLYDSKGVKRDPFELFNHALFVPEEHSGRLTHTYIDDSMIGIVKDYQGKYYKYKELSGVHLCSQPFTMSLSDKFLRFLEEFERGFIETEIYR